MPGLSLKSLMDSAGKQSQSQGEETFSEEPLTFESMMNAWQALADRERSSGRSSLATAMLHHSPGMDIETSTVTFFVSNSSQRDWILEKARTRMEAALRQELHNRKVK